jgi:uncharacterized protein YndB with AHSA1/START domain
VELPTEEVMDTTRHKPLVAKRSFPFPAERVFDAWLKPEVARKWLFTTETSEIVEIEIDARVGGKFLFVDRRDTPDFKGDIRHIGEYLEIDRPRRLVFTFGVPQFDPAMTRVELDFVAKNSGCELTLTHYDVPPEWQERTTEGWTMLLGNLQSTISSQ